MARYDDLDTNTIAVSAVVSSILLIVLILAGRALAYTWQSSVEEKLSQSAVYSASDSAIAAQKAVLETSGKVQDPPLQEGGEPVTRICVPIGKAQELIGKELAAKSKT